MENIVAIVLGIIFFALVVYAHVLNHRRIINTRDRIKKEYDEGMEIIRKNYQNGKN